MAAADDGRNFRVDFTVEGVGLLRKRVSEKLREFMGDYTDDTLVEYIVVLLRNGRRKDEARRELNVFLGDDCDSFVSWLWDHLSSNIHLYAQSKESSVQVVKVKPTSSTLSGRHNTQLEHVNGSMQIDSEFERERSTNVSRNWRNRDLKGLVREEARPLSLRSIALENLHSEEKTYYIPDFVRQSHSPRSEVHRKRSRQDELQLAKRETVSHPVIDAPRRLLQFAVRDALRTVQQKSSRKEPDLKRLRSVVATSIADSVLEDRLRTQSGQRVSECVAMASKTAAESSENLLEDRYPGNIFNRLGNGTDKVDTISRSLDLRAHVMQGEFEELDQFPDSNLSNFYRNGNYNQDFSKDMAMLDRDNEMACDSRLDKDRYDDVSVVSNRCLDVSRGQFANEEKGKLMSHCSVAADTDVVARKTDLVDQDPPATAPAGVPHKIVNISVNVNTWKPPKYENSKSVKELGNYIAGKKIDDHAGKPIVQLLKENTTAISEKEDKVAHADFRKEVQKTVASTPGSYTAGYGDDDVDSRILFVSNVHFAATKDTLSRHFNRFGEVLKVIIVADAATGQPKGSAYIEFLRKESAEHALSLNGTSFMSRILKVVRRSSARHETAPVTRWPRIAQPSPYSSMPGVPFPRGVVTGAIRARIPVKPGSRSLQWKRDAPNGQTTEGVKSLQKLPITPGKTIPTPTGRNLVYIRPELKAAGVSGVVSHK